MMEKRTNMCKQLAASNHMPLLRSLHAAESRFFGIEFTSFDVAFNR